MYGRLTKTSGSVSDFKSGFKFTRVDAILGSTGLTATQTTKKHQHLILGHLMLQPIGNIIIWEMDLVL